MAVSLKKTVAVTAVSLIVILVGMLALGFRQYSLHRDHEEIAAQAEKLLFQYAIIREHIIESLLTDRGQHVASAPAEMENLHANIARLLENARIPGEYKLTFLNQIDLPGISLLLKEMQAGTASVEQIRQLNQETRVLGDRLLLFDRVLVNYAKSSLLRLQTLFIGTLAIFAFITVGVMLLGYRRIAAPLFELLRQGGEILAGRRERVALAGGWDEVQGLADFAGTVLDERTALEQNTEGLKRLLNMVESTLAALHRKADREAMFHGFCRNLAVRGDYCLVWIGEPDGNDIMPVAADGSTTMSGDECKACVAELLGVVDDEGPDSIQLQEVLQGRRAVVRHDILAGLPKGPFKNTPLRDNPVSCAVVPVIIHGAARYVISIYAIFPGCFGAEEMAVLGMLAGELSQALSLEEEKETAAITMTGQPILQAARLASIGELATGIAHEISNLSNGVINYAQLLADDIGGSIKEEQHSLLVKIIKEGERIARTAGNILEFQRDREGVIEPVEIEKVIADTLALIGQQLRNDGIEISLKFQQGMPALAANGRHLQYVYLNIFNNAREALNAKYPGRDGKKRLEIAGEVIEQKGGRWLRTVVTDYGDGFAEKEIDRVFGPDFVVRPGGRAAGFGFAISRDLVGRYGGEMNIESREWGYTSIITAFPLNLS